MVNYIDDKVGRVFAALADPTRRAMLAQLALGETTVSDLAAPYNMSLPAASKHISGLESAGLVKKRKTGRVVHCSFVPTRLKEAMEWMSRYERFWTERLDALDEYLESKNKGDSNNGDQSNSNE